MARSPNVSHMLEKYYNLSSQPETLAYSQQNMSTFVNDAWLANLANEENHLLEVCTLTENDDAYTEKFFNKLESFVTSVVKGVSNMKLNIDCIGCIKSLVKSL